RDWSSDVCSSDLQKGIGKSEIQNIHDRFLAQEVINPINGIFGENCTRYAVELPCRSQVPPEGLFNNDPPLLVQANVGQAADHGFKQTGGYGQVMHRAFATAQGFLQTLKDGCIVVVSADIAHPLKQGGEGRFIVWFAGVPDALPYAFVQLLCVEA